MSLIKEIQFVYRNILSDTILVYFKCNGLKIAQKRLIIHINIRNVKKK